MSIVPEELSPLTKYVVSTTTKNLAYNFPAIVEPIGLLLKKRFRFDLHVLHLDLKSGPAIVRRWTRDNRKSQGLEGYSLSLIIQTNRYMPRRLSLTWFIVREAPHVPGYTLRFHLHAPKVLSFDCPCFKAVQYGDVQYLQQKLSTGERSIYDCGPGGNTFLHVSIKHLRVISSALIV